MPAHCPPNTFSYTISSGDTLYSLARRYDTTVPAIISANPDLKPENLKAGQNICIPRQQRFPSCPEGNYYTVKPGDTLYGIARRFQISLDDLQEANPFVEPETLQTGEVICIPVATPPVECPEGAREYTIKAGDTFYSLAARFNTSVAEIQRLNPDIDPDALLVDQKICIPE
ncbi:MAG: LysM peptidoglycan-binding domain-containing protein [Bacillota bacterium]